MARGLRAGLAAVAVALASYGLAAAAEVADGAAEALKRATTPRIALPAKQMVQRADALTPEGRAVTRGAKEAGVYRDGAPAVVLIVTDDAFGSGVLIGSDGKIVTNLHVVGQEDYVGVIFKPAAEGEAIDKSNLRFAKVIRRDEVADLALIQVKEIPAGITPLKLAEGDAVVVGSDVHAIGHPTGEAWTYTRGIVSQIRRDYVWNADDGFEHRATVIQTQTPINPGNSGGPLLNDGLELVGINSFIGEGEGMGFAVSAADVRAMLARSGDRAGRKAAPQKTTAAQKTDAPCEPAVLSQGRMSNGKGKRTEVDFDCDGKLDAVVVEPDNRREPITTLMDTDANGKPDAYYFDANRDGYDEEVLYDTDEDGKMDLRGLFRKGEDEPYRVERIYDRK